MPFFSGAKALAKKMFGGRKEHASEILDLRGVVVAANVEDVYNVKRRLGEGQTATVYEGIRRADGKPYALKCFKLDNGMQAACEGLRDEVQILRALPEHPGLCNLIEIVSIPGCVYLALELVAGGDLLSPIEERGAYKEQQAMKLFAQMADAVSAMHQAGIVHRDLKPENVCFTDKSRQRIKVIDMGAAGFLNESGLSDLCGTPLYAAPEVTPWYFSDERGPPPPRYDERVDFWSMGVALYVMLSGAAPFDQEQSVDDLLKEVCRGKLGMASPDWRSISTPAKSVVRGLLATDPNQRLPMAELRAHPWVADHMDVLDRERALLADEARAKAAAQAQAAADDPELLKILGYLSRCVVRSSAMGRPTDGLCLLVGSEDAKPKPGSPAIVNPTYTLLLENGTAFVAPGVHLELPLASLACTRPHLLRWVQGETPLIPMLPENTLLASFLQCFSPDAQGFALYCREHGMTALLKGAAAKANKPAAKPSKAPPPPSNSKSSPAVLASAAGPASGKGGGPPGKGGGSSGKGGFGGPPGRSPVNHHVVPNVVSPVGGMRPPPAMGIRSPPPGFGQRPPPPGMGGGPPGGMGMGQRPPPPGMGGMGGMGPPRMPPPPGGSMMPGGRPPPPGGFPPSGGYGGPRSPPPPGKGGGPPRSPPPKSPPHNYQPGLPHQQPPPGMRAPPPPRQPLANSNQGFQAAMPGPPPPSFGNRPPPPGAGHSRSLSGSSGGPGHQRSLSGGGGAAAHGIPALNFDRRMPPPGKGQPSSARAQPRYQEPEADFSPRFAGDLSPRAQNMQDANEIQAL